MDEQKVLVTGGAGYIGSHACKVLQQSGFIPVTFDNLVTGWRDAVKFGPIEQGDLLNKSDVDQVFEKHSPVAVMHFAALSQVGESMQHPINAYGASKRAVENILADYQTTYGLNQVIFRYFNVAGADPEAEIGEFHQPETHLIPLILDAVDGKRDALTIFGTDYDTPDGTCIRDYVHVCDLVEAHVLGLKWLQEGRGSCVFNLGTGDGFSVREVVEHAAQVTKKTVPIIESARRPGDCTKLLSGSSRAVSERGWSATRSNMKQMITDAWRWHQNGDYKKQDVK